MENTGKKIIFFDIMKPLKGALTTPIKTQKGAYYHGKQKYSSECVFFIRAQRIAQHHLESG